MVQNNSQFKLRIANIKKNVPIRSVLEHFGIQCMGSGEVSQVQCPFHGNDRHASARIYATNSMYCWVCEKSWDVISLVQDKLTINFKPAVSYLEEHFKVPVLSAEDYIQTTYKDYSFLDRKIFADKNDKATEMEFERIENTLIKNRDNISFDKYVKLFNSYDSIYSDFKLGIEKEAIKKLRVIGSQI